jgi:hypothetical protein
MKSLEPPEKKMKKVCALCAQHLETEVMARQTALKPLPGSSGVGEMKFSGLSPGLGNKKRLFHATSDGGARAIARDGFMLHGSKDCMFGSGIYLAATANDAQNKAWHGRENPFIIEVEVELGKCWEVPPTGAQKNASELIRNRTVPGAEGDEFHSVWARPRPKGPMRKLDEWVVYDPNQVKIVSIRNPTTKEVIPHKQARPQARARRKQVAENIRASFTPLSSASKKASDENENLADEAKVALLMELGYTKERCEAALISTSGNMQAAVSILKSTFCLRCNRPECVPRATG